MIYFTYNYIESSKFPGSIIGPDTYLTNGTSGINYGSLVYGSSESIDNIPDVFNIRQCAAHEYFTAKGDYFNGMISAGYYDSTLDATFDISDSARNQWTGTFVLLGANGAPDNMPFIITDIYGKQITTTVGEAKRIIIALGNYYYSLWVARSTPTSGSL